MLLVFCMSQPLLFCQAQPAALDVLFVVDNSGSMKQSDPTLLIPGVLARFANGLPSNSQVGILIFDKTVNVVMQVSRIDGRQRHNEVGAALGKVSYKGTRSDLGGAVERAIYELRQHGRPDARWAIVVVTDGVLDLGSKRATAANGRWLREDLAAEAKRLHISVFAVMVSQAADYQVALSLTRTTGGDYYRALAPSLLPQALAEISEKLTKLADNVPKAPSIPMGVRISGPNFAIVSALALVTLGLILVVILASKRLGRPHAHAPELVDSALKQAVWIPSLSALRDQGLAVSNELAKATELLEQASSNVNQFQKAVERYALSKHNELEAAEEQCIGLARECILLLDHLEIMIERAELKNESAESLRVARSRLCNLLEDANIDEIPITTGNVFDSAVQVATSTVHRGGPEGIIAAVSRKGYTMKLRGREVTLRPAGVTVTSARSEAQAGVGGPE